MTYGREWCTIMAAVGECREDVTPEGVGDGGFVFGQKTAERIGHAHIHERLLVFFCVASVPHCKPQHKRGTEGEGRLTKCRTIGDGLHRMLSDQVPLVVAL